MKSTIEGPTTVYRKDYNGKPIYNISMVKTDVDGNKNYGYIGAKFKRGVELSDKTRIDIKTGWLSFYTKDHEKWKETVPFVFISDFTVEGAPVPKEAPRPEPKQMEAPSAFEQIDEDVPF